MSIAFFGTPEFAVPSLKALIGSGEDVTLVVTQGDKPQGRGHAVIHPPVKAVALSRGIPVLQPATLRDDHFLQTLISLRPEFIVVVAYGKVLPHGILDLPERGCINVHASLLPRYRGAAPIAWAIINGEKKSGVTTMLMDEGLDTGPILLQEETAITPDDTAESLAKRLSEQGASLLMKTLTGMREGTIEPARQTGDTSYAPPLEKEDGRIRWTMSAAALRNFIRGMRSWPGAYSTIHGERITILKAEPTEGHAEPGIIVEAGKKSLLIGTGNGLLSIIEVQPSGKKAMHIGAFLQGRRISPGMSVS